MNRNQIQLLTDRLRETYGDLYEPYGTSEAERTGTGFRIKNIPVTFSVTCLQDTADNLYDFQIENYPPGEYLYFGEANLEHLLGLIEKYKEPIDNWPSNYRILE